MDDIPEGDAATGVETIARNRAALGRIKESWSRCMAAGLSRQHSATRRRISWPDVCRRYDADVRLRKITHPVLEWLREELDDSPFTFAFANSDCVIVDALSTRAVEGMRVLDEVQIGACWDELSRGTNAIAIVARSGDPTIVQAREHFAPDYRPMTCVAAPVFGGTGELVGVLDASTVDAHARPPHAMALVRQAARQIEAELFGESFDDATLLRFHTHRSFVHTPQAGLIAFDNDGALQGLSGKARQLLELDNEARPLNIRSLFKGDSWKRPARASAPRFVALKGKRGNDFTGALAAPLEPSKHAGPAATATSQPALRSVFRDPRVAEKLALIERAVTLAPPILITGETGTGKELAARFAHTSSARPGQFVAVNCAAIPHDLVEAELFGYAEGAFTGARAGGSSGLVVEADGGTLFLDEIGDMPLSLQSSMLRLLDYWTVRPVGSNRERRVDVQLVCATHCNLEEAVHRGTFREDLLHRIMVVTVELPPIRERSDFAEIARRVLASIDTQVHMTDAAVARLQGRRWSGNVRELRNVLTQLVLQQDGAAIDDEAVTRLLPDTAGVGAGNATLNASALKARKQRLIIEAYLRNARNVSATARELGISRSTIYANLRASNKHEG